MKYATEMRSGVMIYISSFIKIGSGIRKLIGGIHRQQCDLIIFIFIVCIPLCVMICHILAVNITVKNKPI
jgi:hypothetical protein